MLLTQTETIIENFVAEILENGNDDALFASGYLQGHLDLILQGCIDIDDNFANFMTKMQASLDSAFAKNELAPHDKTLVVDCWNDLQTEFQRV
ncbi:YfcL family protein [Psychrobium sp. MM17-31]|uniref:YfcL family protein n=1 Tax=Psychrobium sp. MM17-31 TaxID=2917758 RepID=UPI001EF4D057|nr:YfcL family protein [Psychrobium sp. MM17-31]MCG7531709.1 YfcL family protein [Psychrobium sp. MM17-31]